MNVVDPRFRAALVTLLDQAPDSQASIARRAHISPSYMSQLVNGHRSPGPGVADALDAALNAGGQLAVLAAGVDDDYDRLAAAANHPRHAGTGEVNALAAALTAQRALDDVLGSAHVIDPAIAQLGTVTAIARNATGPARPALMHVAAQWAQFAGWLHISAGRWDGARAWLATGVEWAAETGDAEITATLVSYQAHLAWLTRQVAHSTGLAEAAARDPQLYPGERAYDLYAAARGHAAMGDAQPALRLLDRADEVAATCASWAGQMPAWHYYRDQWQWDAERGLVLLHLARADRRRARAAVDALDAGVAGIPAAMRGADWAAEYMTHLAGAHWLAGDEDQAAAVLDEARVIAQQTGSTRVLHLIADRTRKLRTPRSAAPDSAPDGAAP